MYLAIKLVTLDLPLLFYLFSILNLVFSNLLLSSMIFCLITFAKLRLEPTLQSVQTQLDIKLNFMSIIGHFQVVLKLIMKARLSAKFLL